MVSTELVRILLLKECQYLGWTSYEENGKSKSTWNKRRSLRNIIVICCVLVVTQNLLLIFEKIKYEISITILHTFLISIVAYLLYIGYLPIRNWWVESLLSIILELIWWIPFCFMQASNYWGRSVYAQYWSLFKCIYIYCWCFKYLLSGYSLNNYNSNAGAKSPKNQGPRQKTSIE